jgi:hypothetical protein
MRVRIVRLIISPDLHWSIGVNIQGPSLIRPPDWVEGRLGGYHLCLADHRGSYIRLAYADALVGPWRVHPPGSLYLAQSNFLPEPPKVVRAARPSPVSLRSPTSPAKGGRGVHTPEGRPNAW